MSFVIQGEITVDANGVVQGVKVSRDQLKGLKTDAAKVETQLKAAVKQTAGVGKASGLAAGQVGNLAAQFNDIGIMMAAGQNPFQLALQQGSQITQVLGPMGTRGAVKALGSAFTSMINPVSLATYAIVGGAAALVSWGVSALKADAEGSEFEGRLEAVTERIAEMKRELRGIILGVSDDELALADAIAAAQERVAAAHERVERTRGGHDLRNARLAVARAEEELAVLQEQLATVRNLGADRETFLRQAGELANQERKLGDELRNSGDARRENAAITDLMRAGVQAATIQAMQLAGIDIAQAPAAAVLEAERLAEALGIGVDQAFGVSGAIGSIDFSSAVAGAQDLSAQLNVSLHQAMQMMGLLGAAAQTANDAVVFDPRDPKYDAQAAAAAARVARTQEIMDGLVYNAPDLPDPTGGGSGRAAGRSAAAQGADQEREAVTDLLESLQQELDITRAADPLLQEMIGYREQLTAATAEERAQVEDLIRARIEEEATLERQQQGWEFWGQTAKTALTDVNSALNAVLDALLEASMLGTGPLGALFGGTNAAGAGGWLGSLIGAIAPGRADGGDVDGGLNGLILGHGTGRADKKVIAASAGEYIVNARATARNRALLDQINYGPPGYANGGMVGNAAAAAGGGVGAITIYQTVRVEGAVGDKDLQARAEAGTAVALDRFSSEVLPVRVRQIADDPERIG